MRGAPRLSFTASRVGTLATLPPFAATEDAVEEACCMMSTREGVGRVLVRVGRSVIASVAVFLGIAWVGAEAALAQDHFERTILSYPQPWGYFGRFVGMDGRWAFVAGPRRDNSVGFVSVLERRHDGWVEFEQLEPRLVSSHMLGHTVGSPLFNGVERKGVTLVFGVPGYQDPGAGYTVGGGLTGYVQVHRWSGTSWALDAILTHPNQANLTAPSGFGASVALVSEDELLVVATGYNASGGLYVFRRNLDGVWTCVQHLPHPYQPGATVQTPFRTPLDVDGSRFVVAQPISTSTPNQGPMRQPAFIGEKGADGIWRLTDWIDVPVNPSVFNPSDGVRPLLRGDNLFVPIVGSACMPFRAYVDVFRRDASSGAWVYWQRLLPQNSFVGSMGGSCTAHGDFFGYSMSMSGGRLAVGAFFGVDGSTPGVGSVTLFEFVGGLWTETGRLRPSAPQQSSAFGCSVAFVGDSVLVGSEGYRIVPGSAPPWGAVFVYDLPRGVEVCSGAPNATGVGARLTVRGSASAAIGDVYLDVTDLPPGAACLGLLGSATGFVPQPGGSRGNLCLAGTLGRFTSQVGPATPNGRFEVDVDAGQLPLATGARALAAGDTWTFQLWYRDILPSGATTSNFSSAVRATFD